MVLGLGAARCSPGGTLPAMIVPARQRFTFDEYLVLEEIAEVKHEFLDGEVWAACIAGIGQTARLTSLACDLAVVEVYRDPLAGDRA